MSNKRKDNKGRVLRTGESQRKDGTYDYRYTDTKNNRCSVYASTLDELRQKETEIQRMKSDGVSYAAADITVLETMMAREGLAGEHMEAQTTKDADGFDIKLEL